MGVSGVGHCSNGRVQAGVRDRGMVPGGYTGWVYQVGNTGVQPLSPRLLREAS